MEKNKWIANLDFTLHINKEYITHIFVNEQEKSIAVYMLNISTPFKFIVNTNNSLWNTVAELKK